MTDAEEPMVEEQEVDIMTEHDCSGLELADRLPAGNRLPEDLRLRDLAVLNVVNIFITILFYVLYVF